MQRSGFDEILSHSVYSSFKPNIYASREAWKSAVTSSDVRLQWDPDHAPDGMKMDRRAIQSGLRENFLQKYSRDWILDITDISEFVKQQRSNATASRLEHLITPRERIYPVSDPETIRKLRLDYTS